MKRFEMLALLLVTACNSAVTDAPPADGRVALGTWGSDSAGAIVEESALHLHVGCTYGDVTGRILLDANGEFTRTGTYVLRAFPVAIGPSLPAEFRGSVRGSRLTVTATIRDTTNGTTVVKGPVTVQLGVAPGLRNCPICDPSRMRRGD